MDYSGFTSIQTQCSSTSLGLVSQCHSIRRELFWHIKLTLFHPAGSKAMLSQFGFIQQSQIIPETRTYSERSRAAGEQTNTLGRLRHSWHRRIREQRQFERSVVCNQLCLSYDCCHFATKVPLRNAPEKPRKCTIVDDCAQIAESGLKPPFAHPPERFSQYK